MGLKLFIDELFDESASSEPIFDKCAQRVIQGYKIFCSLVLIKICFFVIIIFINNQNYGSIISTKVR